MLLFIAAAPAGCTERPANNKDRAAAYLHADVYSQLRAGSKVQNDAYNKLVATCRLQLQHPATAFASFSFLRSTHV